ncbi:MAG TPA: lysophospholipid acyltransferase family protein [Longimicrobiales bacterium]|nr:lysophospholipid acyltransferase family protein [Longimicrobiales bacterium]
MLNRVASAVLWLLILIVATLWLPLLAVIYVATVPRDPGRYTVGRWFRRAAIAAVKLNPFWRFRVSGHHVPDPRRPYVAVSNHESYADIFLISHVPWEMKWLSKAEVFRVPIMGWMMRMAGDIGVHRGRASSRAEALAGMKDRLDKGVSVMVFPEGTRSPTPEMLPFRDGAFRVAIEYGAPILPMAVAGTRFAMARGSLIFNRARAEVRVLEPVETAGMTMADLPRLKEDVRHRIQHARDDLQRELGIAPDGTDAERARQA